MKGVTVHTDKKYLSIDAYTTRKFIPQRYPMMMLDRVKAFFYDGERCVCLKTISQNDPVLPGHFPDFPIFPGVLIIEALAQSSGMLVMLLAMREEADGVEALLARLERTEGAAGILGDHVMILAESKIKHIAPVYPGSTMELHSELILRREGMFVCKVAALADGAEIGKGQLTLAKLPPAMLGEFTG
ncbi:MAG TPA: 3-hydroxyacyl-ACP dehydratase FabZ family protein [Candidatus Competibacter sp.]|nr:3-hydroxyacyl-ACP dehydratase FabZ family protein [Candidatus Competibacter sp.]HUM95572.1 3-hydroxyacyl-ACP dehydratase FabZ family protein [Candidatus Competibacter sp.]